MYHSIRTTIDTTILRETVSRGNPHYFYFIIINKHSTHKSITILFYYLAIEEKDKVSLVLASTDEFACEAKEDGAEPPLS